MISKSQKNDEINTNLLIKAGIGLTAAGAAGSSIYNNQKVLKQFFKNPSVMGEIAPFSSSTIHSLTRPLRRLVEKRILCGSEEPCHPIRVLEIGAGSGMLTKQICEIMNVLNVVNNTNNKDTFDVVEMEEVFQGDLEEIKKTCSLMKLHINDFQSFSQNAKYTYNIIISTLPEQTIEFDSLTAIFQQMNKLLKTNGYLMRVQYVTNMLWLQKFMTKEQVQKYKKVMELKKNFDFVHNAKRHIVCNNVPPTYVIKIKKTEDLIIKNKKSSGCNVFSTF